MPGGRQWGLQATDGLAALHVYVKDRRPDGLSRGEKRKSPAREEQGFCIFRVGYAGRPEQDESTARGYEGHELCQVALRLHLSSRLVLQPEAAQGFTGEQDEDDGGNDDNRVLAGLHDARSDQKGSRNGRGLR